METSLQFAVSSQGTEYKPATFQTINEKNSYVTAECSDRACIRAYDNHRKAQSKSERKETAFQLAKTRYNFYVKWLNKTKPVKSIPPNNRRA